MLVLGLDVGGAHTDVALIRCEKKPMVLDVDRVYLPMWRERDRLRELVEKLVRSYEPELVGLTMTGELADAFENRKEGVEYIVDTVVSACDSPVRVVTADGGTIAPEEASDRWREVASANWRATAELLAHLRPDSYLLVDLGSTTLDLIPVVRGEVAAEGRTDLERLKNGELVYLGALRTPIGFLLSEVEIDGDAVPVSYEYFSIVADALVVLGKIEPEDYTPETPDGRGKSPRDCIRRLARVVCSDPEELGPKRVRELAEAAVQALLDRVEECVARKLREYDLNTVVSAGTGDFLVETACDRLNVEVLPFDEIVGRGSEVAPAIGAAYLAIESIRRTPLG